MGERHKGLPPDFQPSPHHLVCYPVPRPLSGWVGVTGNARSQVPLCLLSFAPVTGSQMKRWPMLLAPPLSASPSLQGLGSYPRCLSLSGQGAGISALSLSGRLEVAGSATQFGSAHTHAHVATLLSQSTFLSLAYSLGNAAWNQLESANRLRPSLWLSAPRRVS